MVACSWVWCAGLAILVHFSGRSVRLGRFVDFPVKAMLENLRVVFLAQLDGALFGN